MIGILLAAGFSKRFGDADKLLHTLNDGRGIAVTAAQNLMAAVPITIAVVRKDNVPLQQSLAALGVHVTCIDNETEMADSLGHAIRYTVAFKEADAGFIIALADMPFIKCDSILHVAKTLKQGATIVVPTFTNKQTNQTKRGHPVGFAARFRSQLENQSGDVGAKFILQQHQDEITYLPCDDAGIVMDIDTPGDIPPA